jgi:NifU-like protein
VLTELLAGKNLAECGELFSNEIEEALDGIPPDKMFCAEVAIAAVHHALSTCRTENLLNLSAQQ